MDILIRYGFSIEEIKNMIDSNPDINKAPKAYTYNLIRRIAIPEVTFLMLTKISDNDSEMYAKVYYDPENK